ncbi:MAG TPA: Spy/CpxP family protein refolding chaperone [Xanthobacteraceae bacterium]|nr:Spy/CpxP family protein refolding chaperone [Xanthobacteraceae bacterium]
MVERMLFRLERITAPTETQRAAFDRLKDAMTRAREIAQAGCPTERPMTPTGRLAAAEKRLETMLQAIRTVRPPLEEFFAQLSEEQKARLYTAMARRHRHGAFHDWRHRRYRDWGGDRPRGERRWRDDDRRDRSEERRGRSRDDDQDRDDDRRGRGEGRDGWRDPWRGRS